MEQRTEPELFKAFKEFIGPSWRGSNDRLSSETGLIVISEQDLDETLMFTRFAVLLQRSGIKVKLLCQPGLVTA